MRVDKKMVDGSNMPHISAYDDAGKLRSVLIHRPGLEAVTSSIASFEQIFFIRARLGRHGFDFEKALDEHIRFLSMLQREGVEALEVEQLLAEALDDSTTVRREFIESYLAGCGTRGEELLYPVREFLESLDNGLELAAAAIRGIRCSDVGLPDREHEPLTHALGTEFDVDAILAGPMNTMYFTRDPAVVMGNKILLSSMYWPDRAREALLYRTIFVHHPKFRGAELLHTDGSSYHIEGGNVLNLGNGIIAIGISERTEPAAVDRLSSLLFNAENDDWARKVLAIALPAESVGHRVHLDAYMTKVDRDAFLVDPVLETAFNAYIIERDKGAKLALTHVDNLQKTLCQLLDTAVRLIPCGGQKAGPANQEALNNAASVLCLEPGRVCACDGNPLTRSALERAGIDVIAIGIDELTYGFGGPCSLCMPLERI